MKSNAWKLITVILFVAMMIVNVSTVTAVTPPKYIHFTTDSITYDPAILLNSDEYPMYADGFDIDLVVNFQTWYETAHAFSRGSWPAMITEYKYSMVDSQDQLQIGGSAYYTCFAFPIAENDCHEGLGEFENAEGAPTKQNMVSLSYVNGDVGEVGTTTDGIIRIEKRYLLTPGETVQFLDHKLMFEEIGTENGEECAEVTLWYSGNVEDDNELSVQVGTDESWFDRHNNGFDDPYHPDKTWYARLDSYGIANAFAVITIGKELSAGDTFYVNGVRYDIPEILVTDSDDDGEADTFWSITISVPLPQGDDVLRDDFIVSSQWITEFEQGDLVPVLPPYNKYYCTGSSIELAPLTAINELGTADKTHTVTATVTDYFDDPVAEATVDFKVISGPNTGKSGSDTTDASGQTTFTYAATQGCNGLGTDTIKACFTDEQDDTVCATATKDWVDTTPPEVACPETVNPHGKVVPPAGSTTLPGPKGGQNEDGFYELKATDLVDPEPQIFVVDTGSSTVFGPFFSGTKIKYTEAPGATPEQKKIGSSKGQAGAIEWQIIGNGDAIIKAVDCAGNTAIASCLVPPLPK